MIEFKTYSDIPKDFTGICKVTDSGTIYHYKNRKSHNESGPAIIWEDGSKIWCINGCEHREDGPAVEFVNGNKHWYYKNKYYGANDDFTIKSWKKKVKELKREEKLKIFI
jgi:hypothetical protein